MAVGVGINGEAARTEAMRDETRAILTIVHDRIELSSWRCPLTIAYLARHLPDLADRFVMTAVPSCSIGRSSTERAFTRLSERLRSR